jgi:hypothetical protein
LNYSCGGRKYQRLIDLQRKLPYTATHDKLHYTATHGKLNYAADDKSPSTADVKFGQTGGRLESIEVDIGLFGGGIIALGVKLIYKGYICLNNNYYVHKLGTWNH